MTLSPEQLAEFPEGPLSDFAGAWIRFQRSSPCTTDKTAFRYFRAPGPEDMDEQDILYGADRETAYRRLMWAFRRCQRQRLLDRYLGPGHTKYYESATVPGLVILSEWAHEQVPFPGYYTGPYRGLRPEDYDEIWVAAGGNTPLPRDPVRNMAAVPELAVPGPLLERMDGMRGPGACSGPDCERLLAVPYLKHLLGPGPIAKLRELLDRSRTEAVYVAVPGRASGVLCRALDSALRAMSGDDARDNENEKEKEYA